MKGKQIAGWVLAASVLVGVSVGGVMYPSLPVLAQRNQGDNLQQLIKRATELTNKGEYAKAQPLYDQALEILNREVLKLSKQEQVAVLRQIQAFAGLAGINRGLLYALQGLRTDAIRILQESLESLEQAWGSNHPDVIQMRQILMAQTQISIQNNSGQTSTSEEAYRLYAVGVKQFEQAQYTQAIESFQRSLAIYEQTLGANHPYVATAVSNLALAYQLQGEYSKAEPLLQRSLAIYEQTPGTNLLFVATALNNLAALYRQQGQYSKAEPLFQRSLAIYEQTLGADQPNVALTLSNLAGLYEKQGQYSKAEPLYQRSLAILEQALGANHPHVATSLNNLGLLYWKQGQSSKAEPLYQRSLAIWEQALGRNHPDVAKSLHNLAGLYREQGQYQKAEPLYQRSLAIWEQALGRNHPDVAASLNNLAVLYWSQNQTEPALTRFIRALDIEETNLAQNLVIGSEEDKRAYLKPFPSQPIESSHFTCNLLPETPKRLVWL
jgi:tetratricopeptide (TPR) repeat protein